MWTVCFLAIRMVLCVLVSLQALNISDCTIVPSYPERIVTMSLPPYKRKDSWRNTSLAVGYDGLYLLCEQQQEQLEKCAKGKAALRDEVEGLKKKLEEQLRTCHNANAELHDELNNLRATIHRQEGELRTLRKRSSSDVADDVFKLQKQLVAERDTLNDEVQLLRVQLSTLQEYNHGHAFPKYVQGCTCLSSTAGYEENHKLRQSRYEAESFSTQDTIDNYTQTEPHFLG